MAKGVKRTCYVRRGIEVRVHDRRGDRPEITDDDINQVEAALSAWVLGHKGDGFYRTPKQARKEWHRQWQAKIAKPLWLLLAMAELRAAIDSGQAKRAGESTEGWEDQVLDGLSPIARPGLE